MALFRCGNLGGGSGGKSVRLRLEHKTNNDQTYYVYVYDESNNLIKSDTFSGTGSYYGTFNNTTTFTYGSDSYSWNVSSSGYNYDTVPFVLSKTGTDYTINQAKSVSPAGNVSQPFDISVEFPA